MRKYLGILKWIGSAVAVLLLFFVVLLLLPGLWCWFWEGMLDIPQMCLSYWVEEPCVKAIDGISCSQ